MNPGAPRLALFTMESFASAEAVRDFVAREPSRIALIVLSRTRRLPALRRRLARSGPRILPYLAANFALPGLLCRRARLSDLAREHRIPWHATADVNGTATHATIRAAAPDALLSFHFDQIFHPQTLALAPLGGVNVHPSLLPRHRGPIPALYGLAQGANGVSVHRLDAGIDTGEVLAQAAMPMPPGTSASAAARTLHLAALPLLERALPLLARPPGPPVPAGDYAPFPSPAALRAMAVPLVGRADWHAALAAPAGGWHWRAAQPVAAPDGTA